MEVKVYLVGRERPLQFQHVEDIKASNMGLVLVNKAGLQIAMFCPPNLQAVVMPVNDVAQEVRLIDLH